VLRSRDGQVVVHVPAHAANRALTLRHAHTPLAGAVVPPDIIGFKRGLGILALDATDDQGAALHQFAEPVTIAIGYTPEQLQAHGIAEVDLTLFWFDDAHQAWVPIPTTVDPATQTASAVVDHFTNFGLSDGSSPSEAYIPSLQGFQVGLSTGSASFSYPIDVPAGPGGLKPSLALSYNSSATDGATGQRLKQQAGWVGKGWSLDTGSVSMHKVVYQLNTGASFSYFSLVLNGQSFDLMHAEALPGNTGSGDTDPTH
jgi:hypothetical protein